MIRMYTDGSSKAGKQAGISVVYPENIHESFAENFEGTNQSAELLAILKGLSKIPSFTSASDAIVKIYTDSEYSINCLTKWLPSWRKNGWKTSSGGSVVHRELIEKIIEALSSFAGHQFIHVRAHTGGEDEDSKWNDLADRMAQRSASEKKAIKYEDMDVKIIRGPTSEYAIPGIPLAIMGSPIEEGLLIDSIMKNIEQLDKKALHTALVSALKKTLSNKGYDLEKTKIHKSIAYRLVEKTHLTIEREEE